MFIRLFAKECKYMLESILYYLFLICLVFSILSQLGDFKVLKEPQPGQEDYGYTHSKDETEIMEYTIYTLKREYELNSYTTYPIGFYKEVKLNEKQMLRVLEILDMISKELEYSEFLKYMKEVDDMLGGGSYYSEHMMKSSVIRPMTYKEAKEEFEGIVYKDNVTRAYARLFCDYAGIFLGILPIFLAVSKALKDKRNMATEIIYSKKESSFCIFASRYLSVVVLVIVPVFILGIIISAQSMYMANILGVKGDILAFPVHIFLWLLPTVLFTLSIGFLFTELTNSVFGVLIHGVLWFISIFTGDIMGQAGFNYIPRFNTLGSADVFEGMLPELIQNRIFYTILSIILFIICFLIFDLKRKGVYSFDGKIFRNRKSKSKA